MHISHDALEVVGCDDELLVGLHQILSGHHAERQLHCREVPCFVTLGTGHAELQAGVVLHGCFVWHFGHVADGLAVFPADDGAVAGRINTLEFDGFKRGLASVPNEDWRGFDGDLFGEVLGREVPSDVDCDLVSLQNHRGGVHFEFHVLDRFDHFGQTASCEEHSGQKGS